MLEIVLFLRLLSVLDHDKFHGWKVSKCGFLYAKLPNTFGLKNIGTNLEAILTNMIPVISFFNMYNLWQICRLYTIYRLYKKLE